MFGSLRDSKLPAENVFSVTVGPSSKQTKASYHLLDPKDVIESIAMLNGSSIETSNAGPVALVDAKSLVGGEK